MCNIIIENFFGILSPTFSNSNSLLAEKPSLHNVEGELVCRCKHLRMNRVETGGIQAKHLQ